MYMYCKPNNHFAEGKKPTEMQVEKTTYALKTPRVVGLPFIYGVDIFKLHPQSFYS